MNRLVGILKVQLDVADKVLGKSVRLDWRPTSTSALIIQLEICRENITWPTKWQWKWRKRQTLCSLSLADNRVESKYFKPHCWNKKIFIIYLISLLFLWISGLFGSSSSYAGYNCKFPNLSCFYVIGLHYNQDVNEFIIISR